MGKRMIWNDTIVKRSEVAKTLTALNLQENEFKLVPAGINHIMIVFIEKKIPNVD